MASQVQSFADFPEDVQLSIISFLLPAELSSFACTSRRSASLCSSSALWNAMLNRRWGSKTLVRRWTATSALPFRRLYKVLDAWDALLGFWRRIGQGTAAGTPPLVFFEFGTSFISGSCVYPSPDAGSYAVVKSPFLWLGLSSHGEPVSFRFEFPEDSSKSATDSVVSEPDLVPVNVSFVGSKHFVVEENRSFYAESPDTEILGTSPPDQLMSEIYQHFANRTSPGGDRASRRQRKRRERERLGRMRWEAEHFVKIGSFGPTPSRPLQGLWKGICEDMRLDFFLVTYDDIGGITCRRVGDSGEPFSSYSPVFWTSNTTFIEPPFSREEQEIYESREHIRPVAMDRTDKHMEVVSRILCINSSYDLVLPDLSGSSGDPRNVEGRIWEYVDGTFGFGFLRNNFIIDLKHITLNGRILDTVEHCSNVSSS
ncbi:F-box protein At3g12350 isoform X1 [Dioscorea cayenensis subsp. rotundata]|uniref:F-box protein n=1 Tax=Dioscorea cayennensis subsp. rotundata TaxID=55577 RepID=A0AB40B0W7_DIOCR|nr:F-box protein At3g12350 isoform X1 [Dioscorea cayenensis subsp. rotundata]